MLASIAAVAITPPPCSAAHRGCAGAFGIDDFGVSEMWQAIIRLDNVVFLVFTFLLFGWQTWRMWPELGKRRQFLCLGLGAFMFAGIEGTIEQLMGWTFGPRVLITWLSCLFVLYAVVLRRVDKEGSGTPPRGWYALSIAEREELESLRKYKLSGQGD